MIDRKSIRGKSEIFPLVCCKLSCVRYNDFILARDQMCIAIMCDLTSWRDARDRPPM